MKKKKLEQHAVLNKIIYWEEYEYYNVYICCHSHRSMVLSLVIELA